ncbi:MAG: DNA translocase FtsK [Candidatus Auribacterota bacterium]|jgi:S-DNA-T family DNA segregation ATPase FtsK/SpoIIIE|nr:DNA translocase FtsK [Candidatus Auribacterota bacterium]
MAGIETKNVRRQDIGFSGSFNKLKEIWAAMILFAAVFLLLSLLTYHKNDIAGLTTTNLPEVAYNFFGFVGATVAYYSLLVVGMAAFVIPLHFFAWSIRAMIAGFQLGWIRFYLKTALFICVVLLCSVFLHFLSIEPFSIIRQEQLDQFVPVPYPGGIVGKFLTERFFLTYLGAKGSILIIGFLIVIDTLLLTDGWPVKFAKWIGYRLLHLFMVIYNSCITIIAFFNHEMKKRAGATPKSSKVSVKKTPVPPKELPAEPVAYPEKKLEPVETKINRNEAEFDHQVSRRPSSPHSQAYEFPPVQLLDMAPKTKDGDETATLKYKAELLRQTLQEFGVEVNVSEITRGPVITRFELTLAPGVKVQRITALADDIALAMKTAHVRIVAPIPGKSAVGIEVPNDNKSMVTLRDLLCSKECIETKAALPLLLAKDISGKPIISDLTAAPHLLIAGATGSGKSVCINTIIMSLIYTCPPDRLKFLMVDPKKVELSLYNDLPHLLAPVITDAKKVSMGLNWVVREMENRYQILADAGVRNIKSFNELEREQRIKFSAEKPFIDGIMPYIVVILDELADLMLIAQAEIEDAIARLAQLSRAVGIHLILATQRPSVNVITGVIKANFPVRISFKVSSKVDSRTVLDANGAEALLGNGDMLFLPPGTSKLIRGQGAYISEKEINKVVEFVKNQWEEPEDDLEDIFAVESDLPDEIDTSDDDLYDQAVETVLTMQQASASVLQRKLRVGYARAARLIDMMEANGVVGPHRGSKPREILIEE